MAAKTKKITEKTLKDIGGNLWGDYLRLKAELQRIDNNSFNFLQALGFTPDLQTYLQTLQKDYFTVIAEYKEREFKKSPLYKEESVKDKSPELKTQIRSTKLKIANKAKEISERTRGHLHDSVKEDSFIHIVKGSLTLSQEDGLHIDLEKYLGLYEDYVKTKERDLYKLQKEVAKVLNKFFKGRASLELLEEFFFLKNGKVKVREESVNTRTYAKIV